MRRSIRFGRSLLSSDALPRAETLRDCPLLNQPVDLDREVASMVARTLHPGHAGPLNTSVPADPVLRRRSSGVWA